MSGHSIIRRFLAYRDTINEFYRLSIWVHQSPGGIYDNRTDQNMANVSSDSLDLVRFAVVLTSKCPCNVRRRSNNLIRNDKSR